MQVAVDFVKEAGAMLSEISSRGMHGTYSFGFLFFVFVLFCFFPTNLTCSYANARSFRHYHSVTPSFILSFAHSGIFERFRGILHEAEIDKRVQYMIEGYCC